MDDVALVVACHECFSGKFDLGRSLISRGATSATHQIRNTSALIWLLLQLLVGKIALLSFFFSSHIWPICVTRVMDVRGFGNFHKISDMGLIALFSLTPSFSLSHRRCYHGSVYITLLWLYDT